MPKTSIERVLGYDITIDPTADVARSIVDWIRYGDEPRSIMCANPHSLVIASRNEEFRDALSNAGWLLPDGVGILYASRLAGGDIRSRITGYDIFTALMSKLNEEPAARCFFLGSAPSTLEKIVDRAGRDYPNVVVSGVWSPPFKDEFDQSDLDEMIAAVNAAAPDVVWVGLTAPKQELFIRRNIDRMETKVVGAIGAVFDFYAETTRRPGPIAQKLGIEWLVRLLGEPRRLWKRTLVSGPQFFALCIHHQFFSRNE